MSQYRWYELHTKLVNGLKKLYEDFDNAMYPDFDYVGEVLFSKCMEKEVEFRKLFNWSKNISEESLDPFHVFVSFNNNNTILDKKLERIQFYFDVLEIPYKIRPDEEDSRFQIPHIPVMQLLTNRPKEKQDEIWHAFINVIVHDDIENIFKYKEWYGIAFTVVTEFLFWINSSKYLSLDSNTEKLLLNYGLINNKIKTSNAYINLIKIKNDTFTDDIFRLIVKFAYDSQHPKNPLDFANLFDFLDKTNDRKQIESNVKELIKHNADYNHNLEQINNQFIGLKIKDSNKVDVKNLDKTIYYKFNELFEFKDDKDHEIIYNKNLDIDLYSLFDEKGNKKFSFNVNAIVGKNGTGKSSLIELFLKGLNNLFYFIKKENIYLNKINGLELELYIYNDSLFKIDISSEIKIYKYQYEIHDNKNYVFQIKNEEVPFSKFFLNEFFTCIFNYSLHSFTNYDKNSWLSKIFKYQNFNKRKIQIEPKREQGNIEINTQLKNLKQKLSYFLLNNSNSNNRKLTERQTVSDIEIGLVHHNFKNIFDFRNDGFNQLCSFLFENFGINTRIIEFEYNILVTTNNTIDLTYDNKIRTLKFTLFLYIKELYDDYEDISKLKSDKSLDSYELRRAIYNFKYLEELGLERRIKKIDVNKFSSTLNNVLNKEYKFNKNIDLHDILPCNKFYLDFLFEEGNSFSSLSSGEKQKIFITTSIAYYLKTLDRLGYKSAMILLDEIELYFHPQMQKDFLFDLHKMISNLVNNEYEGFNVLSSVSFTLITHSPFILSDILNTSLLKLDIKTGKTSVENNKTKTFAANIYDLLKDDFFIKGGFVGSFADVTIKDVINLIRLYESNEEDDLTNFIDSYNRFTNKNVEKLNKENFDEIRINIRNSSERMRGIVSYIGESILRKKLLDDLDLLFPKDNIDFKYNELKNKNLQDIEQELKDLDEEMKISLIKKLLR